MQLSTEFIIVYIIIFITGSLFGLWKIFKKAGQKAWKSIVPIYNLYVWLKILERPMWWFIFIAIPYFNIFMFFLMVWKTIRRFGKTSYVPLLFGTLFPFVYLIYIGCSPAEKFYRLSELPVLEIGVFSSKPLKGKKESIKTKAREWTDAIIYAVVAANLIRTFMFEFYKIPSSSMESSLMTGDFLCVSKMAYGPRVPQTFLAFPFVHHTLPLTKYHKSYIDCVRLPYMRMPGYDSIRRYDGVVFNYPDGDTVILQRQNESYYGVVRALERAYDNPGKYAGEYYMSEGSLHRYAELFNRYGWENKPGKAREVIAKEYDVVARPSDKRENYIKRCVGLPGDVLEIRDGVLYVNGKEAYKPKYQQFSYLIYNNGVGLSPQARQKLNINEEDFQTGQNVEYACLHQEQVDVIRKMFNVVGMECLKDSIGEFDPDIFPFNPIYPWNRDNYGPITIPKAGQTVLLNDSTLCLYSRIIKNYENHELQTRNDKIYIDGEEASSYTFAMDYYWMMGDNRHNSADSRFWGFVPYDHISGKASFVWLSLDKFKTFGNGKIRWKRMFKRVK